MTNDPPFATIETPRLILRWPRGEDAAALAGLMTPEISRWLASWPAPLTEEFVAARIAYGCARAAARAAMPLVVTHRADANVLGWLGVSCDGAAAGTAMLGFWLGAAFHGQGYMREALPPAIVAAFGFLNVGVIEAGAQPENARSLALLAACGMKLTGERMVFAEARGRDEACQFYAISRTQH